MIQTINRIQAMFENENIGKLSIHVELSMDWVALQ